MCGASALHAASEGFSGRLLGFPLHLVWSMSPAMTPDVYVLNVRDLADRLVHTSIWFEPWSTEFYVRRGVLFLGTMLAHITCICMDHAWGHTIYF